MLKNAITCTNSFKEIVYMKIHCIVLENTHWIFNLNNPLSQCTLD